MPIARSGMRGSGDHAGAGHLATLAAEARVAMVPQFTKQVFDVFAEAGAAQEAEGLLRQLRGLEGWATDKQAYAGVVRSLAQSAAHEARTRQTIKRVKDSVSVPS